MATYTNPGYAAVRAIHDYMLEREAAKDRELQRIRQQQQDELAQKRESRIEADADEDRKIKQQARQDAEFQQGYARTEKRINEMVPGDYPDPELINDAKKYGLAHRFATKTTPDYQLPEGSQGPVPYTEQTTNMGTPEQRTQQQRQKYLDTLMSDPDLDSNAKKALEYQRATGMAPPAGIFKLAGTSDNSLLRVDPRGDKVEQYVNGKWLPLTGPVPEKAHWVTIPKETGGQGEVGAVSSMSPQAIDMAAKVYVKTGNLPALGNGAKVGELKGRIMSRAAQYDPATDTFAPDNAGPDVATNKADYEANKKALATLQNTYQAANAFAETAEKNAALLEDIVKDIPDTGVTWLNKPWRAIVQGTGDSRMVEFNAIRQSLQNEYSRLLTSPGMTGVVTNKAREEMRTVLSDSATIPQILAALKTLTAEANNRRTAYATEIENLKHTMGGGQAKSTEKKDETGGSSALPPGVTVKKVK